jgi:hypothetical protein
MVQEENSQQSLQAVREQLFIPEPFSFQWNKNSIELLDISLDFPYSSSEWDAIFETFIGLLNQKEQQILNRSISKLIYALEMEESQRSNCDDYQPKKTDKRVRSIFEAIANQTLNNPHIFEMFCSKFKFLAKNSPYNHLVLEWLNQLATLEARQAPTQEAILAALIFFGAYDSTWQENGITLIELLDRADLNIRACAAYQIGKFYRQATCNKGEVVGIPPLETMMQLIGNKELERPGVACGFWDVIPKESIDAKEWLLNILENLPEPEPYVSYFPCNLTFDAHERFSRDADAIRRLIDMGRVPLALAAATDEPCQIAALKPLLIEMGNYDDPEMIRVASWHLAYYYHYLHSRGAELGYVELVDELSEIDLFLLFSQQKESESPYSVVIYPKGTHPKLSRAIAQRWVDRVFPEWVRGVPKEGLPSTIVHWYQRGYIDYHGSDHHTDSGLIDSVIIGYRSQFPWNPKQFL